MRSICSIFFSTLLILSFVTPPASTHEPLPATGTSGGVAFMRPASGTFDSVAVGSVATDSTTIDSTAENPFADTSIYYVQLYDDRIYSGHLLWQNGLMIRIETEKGEILEIDRSSIMRISTDGFYRVETDSGNVFLGRVIERGEREIEMDVRQIGRVTFPSASIISMKRVEGGMFTLLDPVHYDRTIIMPSGYGLRKGNAYYQNIEVIVNSINVGLFDNLSLSATFLPIINIDQSSNPFWLGPKLSVPIVRDVFNVAAGLEIGSYLDDFSAMFGMTYMAATIGSRRNNVTIGGSFAFSDRIFVPRPNLSFSLVKSIGRTWFLVGEIYNLPAFEDLQVYMVGLSSLQTSGSSIDFGLVAMGDRFDGPIVLPWFSVSLRLWGE